ncbi:MAG: phosphoribosylaminoimidazolesuccinocarboxamide synthase, partial [Micrococcales bacterium]|nr:phosphoribosylaminoimidazolesuccinocarboxamide synthase [Micrococcales bacterium]
AWEAGNRTDSFDKQQVRNWLAANWDPTSGSKPPRLPDEVVEQTTAKYGELVSKLKSIH